MKPELLKDKEAFIELPPGIDFRKPGYNQAKLREYCSQNGHIPTPETAINVIRLCEYCHDHYHPF